MNKTRSSSTVMLPLIVAIIIGLFVGCTNNKKLVQLLNVGIQNSPSNSLIIVAAKMNFFDTTKVKVVIKEFSAGKLALQGLLGQAGDLDIAVSAETPVVLSSLGGNKLKVIAQIVKAKNECRVVVRKDGDLNTPRKYFSKPRKLTTSLGGSPEWFTYNFIKQYNLDKNKVEVLAMLPENMPIALSNSAVDAISIFDPYAGLGEKELGENGRTFNNENIISYYVMSVKESTITQKGEALEELMKGLLKTEEFIKNNPDEAKKIVAEKTKLDIDIVNQTWSHYSFTVKLDISLIGLCNEQAKWAIETGKYPKETVIPNFKEVIYPDILKKVAPKAVDL